MRGYEMKNFLSIVFALFFFLPLSSAQIRGHLVIIGGGDKPKSVLKEFVKLAGGENSKIVIIPNASSEPLEAYKYEENEFHEAGCKNVSFVYCTRQQADIDTNVDKLAGATGIFFSGGDQAHLTGDLLGTKLIARVHEIYKSGGVIGGTSAGAAVMSNVMLTGEELINKDSISHYNSITKDNIETIKGFGFITKAIIDQHFLKRKRNNRLISVVLEHPDLIGVAIDEATSIVVDPDNTFSVLGESNVLVYDATKAKNITTDKNGHLSAANIRLHILRSGDRYNLNTKEVLH
jgi:cyanophycinase